MCFFCFTTDLNYDPQKYGYNLRALANFQLGQKLCPNLHDMFYSVLRGSTTFGFRIRTFRRAAAYRQPGAHEPRGID